MLGQGKSGHLGSRGTEVDAARVLASHPSAQNAEEWGSLFCFRFRFALGMDGSATSEVSLGRRVSVAIRRRSEGNRCLLYTSDAADE